MRSEDPQDRAECRKHESCGRSETYLTKFQYLSPAEPEPAKSQNSKPSGGLVFEGRVTGTVDTLTAYPISSCPALSVSV